MIEGIYTLQYLLTNKELVLTTTEIPNPSTEGPKVMIGCVVIGTVTGTIFLVVLLFVSPSISTVIGSSATPLLAILKHATSNNAGAVCLLVYV